MSDKKKVTDSQHNDHENERIRSQRIAFRIYILIGVLAAISTILSFIAKRF